MFLQHPKNKSGVDRLEVVLAGSTQTGYQSYNLPFRKFINFCNIDLDKEIFHRDEYTTKTESFDSESSEKLASMEQTQHLINLQKKNPKATETVALQPEEAF